MAAIETVSIRGSDQGSRQMEHTADNESDNAHFKGYSQTVVAEIGETLKQLETWSAEGTTTTDLDVRKSSVS